MTVSLGSIASGETGTLQLNEADLESADSKYGRVAR